MNHSLKLIFCLPLFLLGACFCHDEEVPFIDVYLSNTDTNNVYWYESPYDTILISSGYFSTSSMADFTIVEKDSNDMVLQIDSIHSIQVKTTGKCDEFHAIEHFYLNDELQLGYQSTIVY